MGEGWLSRAGIGIKPRSPPPAFLFTYPELFECIAGGVLVELPANISVRATSIENQPVPERDLVLF